MKWKGFSPEEVVALRNNAYTLKATTSSPVTPSSYSIPGCTAQS